MADEAQMAEQVEAAAKSTRTTSDRVALTLTQRYAVLQDKADGLSNQQLSGKYGVAKSTLYKIFRQRDEIEDEFLSPVVNKHKKRDRRSVYDHIDQELLAWFATVTLP